MQDDALMDRFDRNSRRFRARDAIVAIFITAAVLVLIEGSGITRAGEQLKPGPGRDVVLAVGKPAGWVANRLPLHHVAVKLTSGLSPDAKLASVGGFDSQAKTTAGNQVPQVTPEAFPPAAIGAPAPPKKPLRKLLVTGDSLSTPLDLELARKLAGKGVNVKRDPHLGTGISKTDLVDWGKLSVTQSQKESPDAVVVFIGANEGFPMPGPAGKDVPCCGAPWAAIYANRVRQMMNTYRRAGATHVYWITVPTPRDPKRVTIQRVVNAAINVAAQPWRSQVSIVDTVPIFTPGGKYRDAMPISGQQTLVRESDGIHLNQKGSAVLADRMLGELGASFDF